MRLKKGPGRNCRCWAHKKNDDHECEYEVRFFLMNILILSFVVCLYLLIFSTWSLYIIAIWMVISIAFMNNKFHISRKNLLFKFTKISFSFHWYSFLLKSNYLKILWILCENKKDVQNIFSFSGNIFWNSLIVNSNGRDKVKLSAVYFFHCHFLPLER